MKGVSEREWEAFDRVGCRVSPIKKRKKSLLKMPQKKGWAQWFVLFLSRAASLATQTY